MFSTYKSIINNLNMHKILTLEETVCALLTKETKLNDLRSIKKESANFAAQRDFYRGQED